MRFECPRCKKWPPMSNASFCCYCGARFSDHKFEPAELADNYRKFAIKYFWLCGLPGILVLSILFVAIADVVFHQGPESFFAALAFPIAMMLFWIHFEWWYKRKFPNYHR